MIFLTCNDPVNGIFESQVVDVCRYLHESHRVRIQLISLFPASVYKEQSDKLREAFPPGIAVRSVFPLRFNTLNTMVLRRALPEKEVNIWARGVFACRMALKLKQSGRVQKVIYDGRGAVAEEFREYMDPSAFKRMRSAENACVIQSDFRVAVSEELIDYWRLQYGYSGVAHSVIPTTLNSTAGSPDFSLSRRKRMREKLGFSEQDIILVFSGGAADWQSFYLLGNLLNKLLSGHPEYRLLLLLPDNAPGPEIEQSLRQKVVRKFVPPAEVIPILSACDYGLLVREPSITNKVSAPTKYAEYLFAGLPVIISEEVGDYSRLTDTSKIGYTTGNLPSELTPVDESRKKELNKTALRLFSKGSDHIHQAYQRILNVLGEL